MLKSALQTPSLLSCGLALLALASPTLQAQSYDDYSDFAADPVLLDNEASDVFGRFFQNSLLLGTNVYTGGLGAANSAGFMIGMRFVFYFDKVWGVELGANYGKSSTVYNDRNTNTDGIDLLMNTHVIPFNLGLRYGFDQASLPRGFATMNPYLALAGELIYRSERVIGTPTTTGLEGDALKFRDNDIVNTNAIGFNVGGGIEFDVYKNRMLLGFDLRYHVIFWPDSQIKVGNPEQATDGTTPTPLTRGGGYITILGSLTYNY
jgi:opacity protein-like surface antigen